MAPGVRRLPLALSQHAGVAVESLARAAAVDAASAAVQLLYVVGSGKRDSGSAEGGEAAAAVSSFLVGRYEDRVGGAMRAQKCCIETETRLFL